MKVFGFILLLIGIIGLVFILSLGAYSIFGWTGVVILISVLSICTGCMIIDYYEQRELRHED